MKILRNIIYMAALVVLSACEVSSDIPYPIVHGQITEFEVEGQCGADGGAQYSTVINKDTREITLYVCDTVNVASLRIKRLMVSGICYNPDIDYQENPAIVTDPSVCDDYDKFPKHGFREPAAGQNTRVDFRQPVTFVVRTYQDYSWKVTVKQIIQREIEVENQVGPAVIDFFQRNAIIYVNYSQSLKNIRVKKFTLGGQNGIVSPDPTKQETFDFSHMCQFVVETGWGEMQTWNVLAYHTDEKVETTASAFPRNHNITISGTKPNGTTPVVEYRSADETQWHSAPKADMQLNPTSYSVTIGGLTPGTSYIYKVKAGDSAVEEQQTRTLPIQQLPNAGLDDWCTDAANAKLVNPWADGGTQYWDTGNRGATTVGNSNSLPTSDTSTGNGKAAFLETRWVVVKLAAGNIFTGKYLRTDGTNGILGFGRPFEGFPTQMSFDYKYKSAEINKIGDNKLNYLQGRPDSCQIYVALWHLKDGEEEEYRGERFPIVVKTKPGTEQRLFDVNDPRVIAYGEFTQGNSVANWTSETINIKYKNTTLAPTHIQVVATSSKYGDFFTGGVGSTLTLDNIQLLYK